MCRRAPLRLRPCLERLRRLFLIFGDIVVDAQQRYLRATFQLRDHVADIAGTCDHRKVRRRVPCVQNKTLWLALARRQRHRTTCLS